MNVRYSKGFTIIELVLVVAISGLVAATLLGGWSVGVGTQQYKDSVRSLASDLQQQYTDAISVTNDRSSQYTCTESSGSVSVQAVSPPATGDSRGATDCVLMGRYVVINGPVGKINSNDVVGIEPATPPAATATDKQVMQAYLPTSIDTTVITKESFTIPWGVEPYASSASPATMYLALLIIRSPATGIVYTYSLPVTSSEPSAQNILSSGSTIKRTICMRPNSTVAQERLAVVIGPNASSSSAVSVSSASEGNGC